MNIKKQVYELDASNYIKEIKVAEFDEEGNCLEELASDVITVSPPQGLYRARWTEIEWVEDMSQVDIDALNNIPTLPTETEILQAKISELEEVIDTIIGVDTVE